MEALESQIRKWLMFFMAMLFISGLTAIPIKSEIDFVYKMTEKITFVESWLARVQEGIHDTSDKYPFLFYGYDWLAFAHILLAILFIGPMRDPVRNKWVIEFGIISCLLIIPVALIAGRDGLIIESSFRG